MNKTLITLFIFSCSSFTFAEQIPTSLQKFVPQNWEILSQADGDLNSDGQTDTAIIIQPKNIKNQNRKLLILFKQGNNFQQQMVKPIPSWTYHAKKEDCLEDELDNSSLSIKQQVFDLTFNEQPNCANTFGNIYTYRFKLINASLQLIGFESLYLDKLTGKQREESLNFLNKKAKITTTDNIFADIQKAPQIKWISMKSKPNLILQNIPLENEEINYTFAEKYLGTK